MIYINNKTLCQQYLTLLYQNTHGHHPTHHISETYGEILEEGVNKLLSIVKPTANDVFADFGSGLGKVVLQVFLQSAVKESCGIEIVPALHQQALAIAKRVQHDLPDCFTERKLNFLLGNFLEIPVSTATIMLTGSPCYGPEMLHALANVIDKMPNIHTVLTLRPLCTLQRLSFKKAIRVECSWDTALCYLYRR